MMDVAVDPIPISALNHWAYCPRRCGLIHMECEFTDNIHTARGNADHARVDRVSYKTTENGVRIEHALPVWSDALGLVGKCDVVEFWPDGEVQPVEFKHGRKKQRDNDDLQLAAQALCLEEMLDRTVTHGAIFHVSSHRRRAVEITASLRTEVATAVAAIRAIFASARLPAPVNDHRCGECSLRGVCQPSVLAQGEQISQLMESMFHEE